MLQDEREELLKSLREKQGLKKKLADELNQYKDCDPTTITHMRMYKYTLYSILPTTQALL